MLPNNMYLQHTLSMPKKKSKFQWTFKICFVWKKKRSSRSGSNGTVFSEDNFFVHEITHMPANHWQHGTVMMVVNNTVYMHQNCCGSTNLNPTITVTDLQKMTVFWHINNFRMEIIQLHTNSQHFIMEALCYTSGEFIVMLILISQFQTHTLKWLRHAEHSQLIWTACPWWNASLIVS